MSQPPTNSPSTKICGMVGQFFSLLAKMKIRF